MTRNEFPLVDVLIGYPLTGPRLGAPALLTHGTVLEAYVDEACTTLADIADLEGNPIETVTVVNVSIPRFLGPDDSTRILWLRPVGQIGSGFLCRSVALEGEATAVTVAAITDAGTTGKDVLLAETKAAGRTALGFTATGSELATAASPEAARLVLELDELPSGGSEDAAIVVVYDEGTGWPEIDPLEPRAFEFRGGVWEDPPPWRPGDVWDIPSEQIPA